MKVQVPRLLRDIIRFQGKVDVRAYLNSVYGN
jgi:hypothetical protein